jgi:hypothetical protein
MAAIRDIPGIGPMATQTLKRLKSVTKELRVFGRPSHSDAR